jgi:hypothetical protein
MSAKVGEILLVLMAFALFAIALEIGYRIGMRRHTDHDPPEETHANALNGATLGLLALLLGFTFAMAVSRYETRKQLMVAQANAIGTAELRARMLPVSASLKARDLLRQYLDSRLQYNAAGNDEAALQVAENRASDLENQLWVIAGAALADDPRSQPASLLTQALNDMFDLREKRRFALNDQVPAAVTVMLYAVAFTAMGLVAYSCGLNGRRRAPANLPFALLIAMVLTIILDVDNPRAGFVRVSQESLVRLQQSLAPAQP